MIRKKHIHLVDMMDFAEGSSAAESIRTMIFLLNCLSFPILKRSHITYIHFQIFIFKSQTGGAALEHN